MSRRFNSEEITFIKENIDKMKYKEIAHYLNCSEQRIASWVSRNNIKKNQRSIFSEEDIQFMKENYSTMTYHEIAEKLGFSEKQVRGKINNRYTPIVTISDGPSFRPHPQKLHKIIDNHN